MIITYTHSTRWFSSDKNMRMYFSAIGLADSILYYRVPVIWELAKSFFKFSGISKEKAISHIFVLKNYQYDSFLDIKSLESRKDSFSGEISFESRLSFEKAFGLTPAEQVTIEESFQHLNPFL